MSASFLAHPAARHLAAPRENVWRRDPQTQLRVKAVIAELLLRVAAPDAKLLEVGGDLGWQTLIYRDLLPGDARAKLYDWRDRRPAEVKAKVALHALDLEVDRFPDETASQDLLVCNQVLEHLKNIFTPLSEMARVLKPGGHLVFSVPNLAAFHNRLWLLAGAQPTTIASMGAHVRGFTLSATRDLLCGTGLFDLVTVRGVGLHPFTSAVLPAFLKGLSHTPVLLLRRTDRKGPTWVQLRKAEETTTKFFAD